MTDRDILIGSRSWSATPWNYSSMVYLQFAADGSGLAIYGYGQTIYAKLNFTHTFTGDGRLRLTYVESPPLLRFRGFVPTDDNRHRDLTYTLVENPQVITESVVARDFRFQWELQFNESPFPNGLTFPYDVPRLYYGYREDVVADNA